MTRFLDDVLEHRGWYFALVIGVAMTFGTILLWRTNDPMLHCLAVLTAIMAVWGSVLLTCSDVPETVFFMWLDVTRVWCRIFGCNLADGWGGGGMHIPEAECRRCDTMCGNADRPLFKGPAWHRRERVIKARPVERMTPEQAVSELTTLLRDAERLTNRQPVRDFDATLALARRALAVLKQEHPGRV